MAEFYMKEKQTTIDKSGYRVKIIVCKLPKKKHYLRKKH